MWSIEFQKLAILKFSSRLQYNLYEFSVLMHTDCHQTWESAISPGPLCRRSSAYNEKNSNKN